MSRRALTIIVVLFALVSLTNCGAPTTSTTPPPPSSSSGSQAGADSPENAAIAAYKAIEANDANAYLDVIDPQFRSNIGNYFFFSQFLAVLTEKAGLGGTLGKDASKVNFRDLNAKVIGSQGPLTSVYVAGFIRSAAFATENAFNDTVLVRQIQGRWFISAPTTSEIAFATQTAKQATDQQAKSISDVVVQKGELVAVLCVYQGDCSANTLRPGAHWVSIPTLAQLGKVLWTRLSPDRKKVAFEGLLKLGIMDVDGRNARNLQMQGVEDGLLYPRWSPDSQRLVVTDLHFDGNSAVAVVDLVTGKVNTVWKGRAREAIFTLDGKRLLLSYEVVENGKITGGKLVIYDPDTGDEKVIASLPDAPGNMAWSPDGKVIAFNYGVFSLDDPQTTGIWLINPDGSGLKRLVNAPRLVNPTWSPDGTFLIYQREVPYGLGTGSRFIEIVRSDGSPLSASSLELPSNTTGEIVWWIDGSTPAVKAQIDFVEQGSKDRTIAVNLTTQKFGLNLTLKEFQITKDRIRVHLLLENNGNFGRVFLQPTDITLYTLNQTDVTGKPTLGNNPLKLRVVTDMPSTLPTGRSWDGWLESDKPTPSDAVGAILVFKSFEFENPYDQQGSTKSDWNSTQEGKTAWYQPLR